jgi:hypothetical protein
MNTTEFRAAVEKIIGVPASNDHAWFWQLDTPNDGMHIRFAGVTQLPDLYFKETFDSEYDLLIGFDDGHSPGFGENPYTGRWHIRARHFNNDPEAVLRELARRLAAAGYEAPAEAKPVITVNPPEHYRKIFAEEIERSMMTGEAGTPVFLTKEERQMLRAITSHAFMYRTLFHQIAGLPGKQEYDTESTLNAIHGKLAS